MVIENNLYNILISKEINYIKEFRPIIRRNYSHLTSLSD